MIMANNFETRILIYSIILAVMFAFVIFMAYLNRPDKKKRIVLDDN